VPITYLLQNMRVLSAGSDRVSAFKSLCGAASIGCYDLPPSSAAQLVAAAHTDRTTQFATKCVSRSQESMYGSGVKILCFMKKASAAQQHGQKRRWRPSKQTILLPVWWNSTGGAEVAGGVEVAGGAEVAGGM